MPVLRLFFDLPAAGDWNMAVDEALLEDVAGGGEPALRFYAWSPATLSLGYFQRYQDRQQHSASLSCPYMRRQSGGGAILHDRELTYSLAVPATVGRRAEDLYHLVHETLIDALAEMGVAATFCDRVPLAACQPVNSAHSRAEPPVGGPVAPECPFLCFERRSEFDVLAGDVKIAGSAQRRRRGALLQHGSVLLAASEFAPELPGIREASGISINSQLLATHWSGLLAARIGGESQQAVWPDGLLCAAESLRQSKYATDAWNLRR